MVNFKVSPDLITHSSAFAMPEKIAEDYFPDLFSVRTVIPLFKCLQLIQNKTLSRRAFWLGNMISFHTTKSEHMVDILLHKSAVGKGSQAAKENY